MRVDKIELDFKHFSIFGYLSGRDYIVLMCSFTRPTSLRRDGFPVVNSLLYSFMQRLKLLMIQYKIISTINDS